MAEGVVFVPNAIPPAVLAELLDELADRDFVPLEQYVGEVQQFASQLVVPLGTVDFPATQRLAEVMSGVVAASGAAGLDDFPPTEGCYQRYRAAPVGVSAHRDSKRYRGVIVAVTVEGSAIFEVLPHRQSTDVLQCWTVTPGDVVVIRGSVEGEHGDRPMHRVSAPLGDQRTSLTFRSSAIPG